MSFIYDEKPRSILRPRHPIVCMMDVLGMLLTLFFFSRSKSPYVDWYLASLWLLYFFSTVHHWCTHANWRRKLDHTMIFVVIAMTAFPYWGQLFPFEWKPLGPTLIIGVIIIGSMLKYFSFFSEKMSAALYVTASLPMLTNAYDFWELIPAPWNTVFMTAIACYGVQLCIYTFRWLDFKPNLMGFREYQHMVLLVATSLHSLVAVVVVR